MPLFISYGSYTQTAIQGMIKNPVDRAEAMGSMIEQAGGKLVALYMTTGENDFCLISEAPDGEVAVALGMVAAASGRTSKGSPRKQLRWLVAIYPQAIRNSTVGGN